MRLEEYIIAIAVALAISAGIWAGVASVRGLLTKHTPALTSSPMFLRPTSQETYVAEVMKHASHLAGQRVAIHPFLGIVAHAPTLAEVVEIMKAKGGMDDVIFDVVPTAPVVPVLGKPLTPDEEMAFISEYLRSPPVVSQVIGTYLGHFTLNVLKDDTGKFTVIVRVADETFKTADSIVVPLPDRTEILPVVVQYGFTPLSAV